MIDQYAKDAANYVAETIQGNPSHKALRPESPDALPEKLKYLDNTIYLTIYDTQGKAHEGTKVKLEHKDSEWVLTVKLRSDEERSFTSSEISAITRHT